MRLETKSLTVSPSEEQNTIDLYQKFGWSVQSSQEIFSKNTHLESSSSGDLKSVTETTNYVKLTLQRDKDMDHYSEIKELENKYFNLGKPIPPKSSFLKKLGIVLLIASVIFFFERQTVVIGLILIAGGIVSLVFGGKKKKANEAIYAEELENYNDQVERIFSDASAYC